MKTSQKTGINRRTALALTLAASPAMSFAQARPLKIGLSMSLSGGLAPGGKAALLTYQIWQEEVNARGGLLGRKVEFIYYDDQSNASLIPSIYSKLLDIDKVDMVISPYGTVPIVAVLPTVIGRKKTMISFFATGANEQFKYDRYFTLQPSGPDPQTEFSRGFFELAAGMSPKPQSVAIVGADLEFSMIAMKGAREHAKKQGFKVVFDRSYPPTTVDFNTIVRTIKATRPDLVYIASYPTDTAGMVRAIYEVGLSAKMVGGGMVGLQFAGLKTQLGPLLNNLVAYDYYAPEPTMQFPGVNELLAKYRQRAVQAGVDPLGLYITPFAYAQMQILEDAVKAVGSTDDTKLAAHLHATRFKTIVGDIKFGPHGEWEQPRIITVQYQNVAGNDVEQFKNAGRQVILHPQNLRSGELKGSFVAAKP